MMASNSLDQQRKRQEDLLSRIEAARGILGTSEESILKQPELTEKERSAALSNLEEQKARLDDAADRAEALFEKRADRAEWLQLAELVGRNVAKLGMAREAARSGVDISNVQLDAPTDFGASVERAGRELERRLGGIREERAQAIGEFQAGEQAREARLSGLEKALERRIKVEGELGKAEREEEKAKLRPQGYWKTETIADPVTGEPQIVRVNPATGEMQPLGIATTRGIQMARDPLTGELINVRTQERIGARKQEIEEGANLYDRLPPKVRTDIEKARSSFEKETSKERDVIDKVISIDSKLQLAMNNPLQASQIGVQIAKALGEANALSDADVTRYVENKAARDRVEQSLRTLREGTMTPRNVKFLRETMKLMRTETEKAIQRRALEKAGPLEKSYGSTYKFDSKDLIPLIYSPAKSQQEVAPSQREVTSPQREVAPTAQDQAALQWLEANPSDPQAPAVRQRLKAKGLLP